MDSQIPYGYIYKIDFPNDKVYIGLTTTSLKQRKTKHKSSAKTGDTRCLYNALRKYNMVDTFELIVIDTADTEKELCEKEIMYIFEYNSHSKYGCGYNMTDGGEGVNGYVYTQDQRQKMSEIGKQYYVDNPHAKTEHSERKRKYYEDHPEARQKNGETLKKHYEENPEARLKMSEALKKHYEEHPEARLKMSEIQKKNYEENPATVKKILDTKGLNKAFDVFKKDGTFIKTFTYQRDAREYLKKEHNITGYIKIGEVLCGNRKSSAGFVFINL